MSEQTKIAWCDSTVNFWSGCTKVSAGCANCYAEGLSKRGLPAIGGWGKGVERKRSKSAVKDALAFNRRPRVCDKCGVGHSLIAGQNGIPCTINGCSGRSYHRRRIFSLSLGDWLDDEVPIEWLAEMLDTIRQCDQVEWILCTKRPELWRERMEAALLWLDNKKPANRDDTLWGFIYDWLHGSEANIEGECSPQPPENIILLASVENQAAADLRIPQLLAIPAWRRGLSIEPLLGAVELRGRTHTHATGVPGCAERLIDWLIIGGESGANARPCNVDWIRDIVRQGKAAGVPVFVKQLGARPESDYKVSRDHWLDTVADKKGGDISEWPDDLKVREFYR